jgi:hypothetical protein
MNFFAWIRDGVKNAVLLGVTDAVGDLGTPADGEDIRPQLLQALRNNPPQIVDSAPPERPARKKLGRSLDQIPGMVKT